MGVPAAGLSLLSIRALVWRDDLDDVVVLLCGCSLEIDIAAPAQSQVDALSICLACIRTYICMHVQEVHKTDCCITGNDPSGITSRLVSIALQS